MDKDTMQILDELGINKDHLARKIRILENRGNAGLIAEETALNKELKTLKAESKALKAEEKALEQPYREAKPKKIKSND